MSATVDWDQQVAGCSAACVDEESSPSRSLRRTAASPTVLGAILRDTVNVPRYVLKNGILVLALLGLLQLWAVEGDGPMPAFNTFLPSVDLDPHRVSSPQCVFKATGDRARWSGLSPALAILAQANPEVARWAESLHAEGRLVFTDHPAGGGEMTCSLAKFDHLSRKLRINPGLYAEPDGSIAAILCHEYRHSRQGFPKVFGYALSFVLRKGGDPSIVENDAVLYEQQARCVIFGQSDEALEAHIARLASR